MKQQRISLEFNLEFINSMLYSNEFSLAFVHSRLRSLEHTFEQMNRG